MPHLARLPERRHAPRALPVVLAVATVLFAPGIGLLACGRAAAQAAPAADAAGIATRLLDHLDAGRYAQAEAMFDARMAADVPAAKLEAVWEALPAQVGAATGRGAPTVATQAGIAVASVPLHHEKTEMVARIAVDAQGRVSGFVVRPAGAPAAPAPAVPADAAYAEAGFAVGTGDRALPGTLALPAGEGPFPAVVLVHGSGSHDRDETIGPNRPFLDIARGLAARGIAVLRYDKRTHAQPQAFAGRDFTIDDETTDDAVAAVQALRGAARIDPKRVFVFGHSQGAMMAPRIAQRAGHVAGLVLLAAPARPLLDILVEQNQRLAVLDDARTSDAERSAIDALKAQVRAARSDPAAKPGALPLGLPAAYWRSTDAVHPVAEAVETRLPVLVLQGARDIQVVDADWQRWKSGFAGDDRATFKLYPSLNHLGIPGEGPGSLAEYATPGHVDAALVGDVAAWIEAH